MTSNEEIIKSKVDNFEAYFSSSMLSNDKKLCKISKQLEILEMSVRKINASKRKDKRSKDLNKRLTKMEESLKVVPQQLVDIDKSTEEVIAKIINIESNKCNYIPPTATSAILANMKREVKEQEQNECSSFIEDLAQD